MKEEKIYTCICGKTFTKPNAFNGHKAFCTQYRISIGKDPDTNKNLSRLKMAKCLSITLENRQNKHFIEKRKCITCGKEFEVDNFSKQKCCSSYCSHKRNNSGPSKEYLINKRLNTIKKYNDKVDAWKQSNPKCNFCGKFINTSIGNPFRHFCDKTCIGKYANQFKTYDSFIKSTRKGNAHHGWYNNIPYDSSWELAFLIYHVEYLNKNVMRYIGWRIYLYNNQMCRYYPDFIIDNNVYEVKGLLTDRDKAKLDQHKDIILVSKDLINTCLKYSINKYGTNFWELFP